MTEQKPIFDLDDDLPCQVFSHTDSRLQFQPASTTHGEYELIPALHYKYRNRLCHNNLDYFQATPEIHFSEQQPQGVTSGFSMPTEKKRAEKMIMRPNDSLIHERLKITFAVSRGRLLETYVSDDDQWPGLPVVQAHSLFHLEDIPLTRGQLANLCVNFLFAYFDWVQSLRGSGGVIP